MNPALPLLFVSFLIPLIHSASVSCGGSKLPPALVQRILDQHNTYRSTLANGLQPKKGGGFAPSGKNMYRMTWNCNLESTAQTYADTCAQRPGVTNDGENIDMESGSSTSMNNTIPKASDHWWAQYLFSGPVNNSDNILTQDVYNHGFINWFQMAWGATTEIGCGFANCLGPEVVPNAFIVCRYRTKGNIIDQPIYELGTPCTKNHDCTTYPNSKCSTSDGLCYL